MPKKILSVDIGGTNSRFAHFELEANELILCKQYTCNTSEIQNTTDALQTASNCGLNPLEADMQIWGVAGIIESAQKARLTNSSLQLDFSKLKNNKNHKNIILLNDFVLQAWSCLLPNLKTLSIRENKIKQNAPKAILGAGTGLGTAAIVPDLKNNWVVMPAEGGHTEMPIQTKEEHDFAYFAKKHLKQERLSAEDILSSKGMSLLYLYEHKKYITPEAVATQWQQNLNCHGLNLYAAFLGRFCRHWALNTLCLGGLYLAGGVLNKNPDFLQNPYFEHEFIQSPKAMDITHNVPIKLIIHEHASLWGGAYVAKNIFMHH